MIFRSITIGNLFCYNGIQTLDLAGPGPNGANVALVIGRNGYGKTSLLNAVKLLFLGTEVKRQRQVGFPPMNLQQLEYIVGKPGRWLGVRNRSALRNGAEDFFVKAVLETGEGTVTITRQFTFNKAGKFDQEILRYSDESGDDFTEDAAQGRLDTLLPADLVSYFFFDGEEIQYLAEAPDAERQAAMERLLRLNFLTGVEEAVGTLARDWLRAELPDEIRGKIAEQESECAKLAGEQARLSGENHRLDMEESQLALEIDRLARRMKGLRSVGAVANTAELEQRIAVQSRELEERQNVLATEVAADAPLLVAPGLIAAGIGSLSALVERKAQSKQASFKDLFDQVPARLFDEPPQPQAPIPEHARNFYKRKLEGILATAALEDSGPPHPLDSLDLQRARQLLEKLTTRRATWPTLRQARAGGLREISRLGGSLRQLKEELRKAEFSEPETAREYEELQRQRDEANRRLGEIAEQRKTAMARLERLATQLTEHRRLITQLEKQVNAAHKDRRRLEIADGLQKTFHEYKNIQRKKKRKEIEDLLNERFACLMDGHRLVDHISIDENFHMHLNAANGGEIGLATVSHGMRQLTVTALLWALKDLARNHPLPVIVDTPLARIDRQNQNNLLTKYYPNAAQQVILLATDSEIDPSKFERLRPHLYRQTLLHNPTGERAEFESCSIDKLATE